MPNEPFFCDTNGPGRRSNETPTSVHKLKPGDIDIIAAIGDSLTAGNGNFSSVVAFHKYVTVIKSIYPQGR